MSSSLKTVPSAVRKPLKWAGGKGWLVPKLLTFWKSNENCRLVEPFVGGMSVALGLSPQTALLNDANKHLINFYQHIQSGLVLDIQMENNREVYLQQRERFNKLILSDLVNSSETAQLFYYLNRTGYNGLCRFSTKYGERFNVPFGTYANIDYAKDFLYLKSVLKNWQITNLDYNKVITTQNDFIYADPPYDVPFTKYTAKGFTWEDQINLAEWLNCQPGKVVVSNQATDRILKLYKSHGFNIETVKAPRRISCDGDRTPVDEMLAWKGF